MCPTPQKYSQLLDKAWVLEQLQTMSIAQLAKSISAPRSSVQWFYDRYLSDAEQATVKKERLHQKGNKKDKITNKSGEEQV